MIDEVCGEHPVFIPSQPIHSFCTPHHQIVLAGASMLANQQGRSNVTEKKEINFSTTINEAFNAVIQYRTKIIISFAMAVVVALLVIFVVQIATKYIITLVTVAFFLASLGAIGFVWLKFFQLHDPSVLQQY